MRIISEKHLRNFWDSADRSEGAKREKAMREWIAVVRKADWKDFADIRRTFNHSDICGNCTIFDVGGNKYRIIAKVAFGIQIVFIRFVLTHAEYYEKKWQADCIKG